MRISLLWALKRDTLPDPGSQDSRANPFPPLLGRLVVMVCGGILRSVSSLLPFLLRCPCPVAILLQRHRVSQEPSARSGRAGDASSHFNNAVRPRALRACASLRLAAYGPRASAPRASLGPGQTAKPTSPCNCLYPLDDLSSAHRRILRPRNLPKLNSGWQSSRPRPPPAALLALSGAGVNRIGAVPIDRPQAPP